MSNVYIVDVDDNVNVKSSGSLNGSSIMFIVDTDVTVNVVRELLLLPVICQSHNIELGQVSNQN